MIKVQTFEEFLKDIHGIDYHGTDDDMPEAFDHWLVNIDADDILKYGEEYGKKMLTTGRVSVLKEFDGVCIADAMVGFTADEWTAVKKFFAFNKSVSGWDKPGV